jgi:tRNA pseudouridine13 synthase
MTNLVDADPLSALPYLTADIAPVAAAIKRRYEDFSVEEIAAYEPCGQGDHVYFTIEKRGLSTLRAVGDIARKLGVLTKDIGLAGLKDARAVAVQTLSVEHVDPRRLEGLDIPRIRVLGVTRHRNKLKIGHLHGNRFVIRLRDVEKGREDDIARCCEVLLSRGVPNYFGQQRFGSRGDTWRIGQAVLENDQQTAIDLMLGRPGPSDTGDVLKARQLYDAGDFAAAAKAWPYGFRDNVRACRVLERNRGNARRAFHAVDQRLKKFYVNAFQSHLFNRVLGARIDEIDRVRDGDLAWKHDNGAVFRVEDAAVEKDRAGRFEISPTGPIFAPRMTRPGGDIDELEQSVLREAGIGEENFARLARMKLHGARRPLRFRPEDLQAATGRDEHGYFVELRFSLPAGCYATMILREICKTNLEEGLEEDCERE